MNGKPPDGCTAEWNADFKSYNDHGFRRIFTSAVASAVPTLEVDAVDDRAEDVAQLEFEKGFLAFRTQADRPFICRERLVAVILSPAGDRGASTIGRFS